MIRLIFRTIALIFLAIAVMYAVIDVARTLADSEMTLTTIGESAALAAPQTLAQWESTVGTGDHSFLTPDTLAALLALPTCLLALGFAWLFYLIGRKPRQKGRILVQ